MFQNLRQSSQVYILHKTEDPCLETGTVVSVSIPTPKYTSPQSFGQPVEMVVDLTVRVGEQDLNYQKLPANAEIADFGNHGVTLSCSRAAMIDEVNGLKRHSEDIVGSVDYHHRVIGICDEILSRLNPEFAEKKARQAEINELKKKMDEIMKVNAELMEAVKGSGASFKTRE